MNKHFDNHHHHTPEGRYQVELPKRPVHAPIGESRSQAVRRFESDERNLHRKGMWESFHEEVEYFKLGHAEPVPASELRKSYNHLFYLPMYAVHKSSSSTTKLRVVFDTSVKSGTGVSCDGWSDCFPSADRLLTEIPQ